MRAGSVIEGAAVVACLMGLAACPSSLGPELVTRNDAGPDGGPDPCEDMQCPGGQICSGGQCVRLDQCEGIECTEEGTVCSYGSCVNRYLDEDGDGSPASDDCDDGDPSVLAGSVRTCQTRCAEGLSTCFGADWLECSAPDDCACEPGEVRLEACGSCGEAKRTCADDGTWGGLGTCNGESECPDGATGVRPCEVGGACSNQSRLCGSDCRWGEWGACETQTECDPEAIDVQACGMCGTHRRECGSGCLWGTFEACVGEGECQAGAQQFEDCGDCGTRIRVCSSSCSWAEWGDCAGEGPCTPGQVEGQTCGNCGGQSHTCSDSCTWGPWGECTGQGVCQAGETDPRGCGNCGSGLQTRPCLADCTWGSYDTCDGPGCGDLEDSRDCGAGGPGGTGCGTQSRSCSAACTWSGWGACASDPARENECNDGSLCTTDVCSPPGDCSSVSSCSAPEPACCGPAAGCQECCGADASTCTGQPGTCRKWACQGNSCVVANQTDGTDPDQQCGGRGGLDICCNGACQECCGASTSSCGVAQACHIWLCQAGSCVDTIVADGTDDCAIEGEACCRGICTSSCLDR